ncbi:MAG: RsmG family class I SAM-dependent methyltransferase [Candidatus Zixiibacteriota bacterium]
MTDQIQIPIFNSEEILSNYHFADRLNLYIDEVLEYNKKVNIVSRETSAAELRKIAADCLVPFEFLAPPGGHFFDIGSGGGFPSIVLLLAFPGLRATLFERTGKKVSFLRRFIEQSQLSAEVIKSDFVENHGRQEPGSFDFGTIKLVRPDKKILRGAMELLRPGAALIYYASAEKANSESLASFRAVSHHYYLDDSKALRAITFFSKQ